jgi:Holliday junction resolvase
MQRVKGAVGEREVAGILRDHGFNGRRTAPLQTNKANPEADVAGIPGHHLEIKRQERISIEAWCQQAEADAPEGVKPVVVFRRSRQPWRVTLKLDDFLELVKEAGRG